jgi:hypothetical protein
MGWSTNIRMLRVLVERGRSDMAILTDALDRIE